MTSVNIMCVCSYSGTWAHKERVRLLHQTSVQAKSELRDCIYALKHSAVTEIRPLCVCVCMCIICVYACSSTCVFCESLYTHTNTSIIVVCITRSPSSITVRVCLITVGGVHTVVTYVPHPITVCVILMLIVHQGTVVLRIT